MKQGHWNRCLMAVAGAVFHWQDQTRQLGSTMEWVLF